MDTYERRTGKNRSNRKKRGDETIISQYYYLNSAKPTTLKPKGFGNFSEISASSSLFLPLGAGW